MKTFEQYFQEREENETAIQGAVLTALSLDPHSGLSTPLSSFNPKDILNKIQGLGYWKQMSPEKQNALEGVIHNQQGIVGDLVQKMLEPENAGPSQPGIDGQTGSHF